MVALVPPAPAPSGPAKARGTFGFELGEAREPVLEMLARAEPSFTTMEAVPIVDSSELSAFAPAGGRLGSLKVGPPVSCDIPAARAGEPRFPIGEWQHDSTSAWIVSGSPECASDLAGELSAVRAKGVVALTLEAASLLRSPPGLRVVSARAGVVPEADPRDPRSEELHRFTAALGPAGWWTALGRDAATLARTTLLGLPADAVSEPRAVADRRAAARAGLASTRARLWTTESSGWNAERTMNRTVCAVEGSTR